MWINRDISEQVLTAAGRFPVVVVTGARQVGKTELLRRLFPSHTYVSLDLPSIAAQAEEEPSTFLSRFPPPLLIDEVQYAPLLLRHLKVVVDQAKLPQRFILTGSQRFPLMKGISESLAGRAAIIELETLSYRETRFHMSDPSNARLWSERLVRGGFPALFRDPDMPLDLFYSSYLATYLERDLRQLLQVSSLRHFERFVRACAARNAQTLDNARLASDVGVSASTIAEWLHVLTASNQVYLLEPWFANITKRLVKKPKLYFADTGLLCYLLGLTEETLPASPLVGPVWECAVYAELRKQLARKATRASLWFYRDKQQLEVDFVLMSGGTAHLLECKWTELPQPNDKKGLRRLSQLLSAESIKEVTRSLGYVVCRTSTPFPLDSSTQAIGLGELGDLLASGLHPGST